MEYIVVLIGGFVAGFINVLAGNGSAITLAILTDVSGLSPIVANGTNRIGILAHGIVSVIGFNKKSKLDVPESKFAIPYIFFGGIVGGFLATQVDNGQFSFVYRLFLFILLITVFFKPKRWLNPDLFKLNVPKWLQGLSLFLIGIYGGFIQMGTGIMILATLVLVRNLPLMKANAIKLAAVLSYTLIIIWSFVYFDLINWYYGILMAVGQVAGALVTIRYLVGWKYADKVAYYTLIVVIVGALVKNIFFN